MRPARRADWIWGVRLWLESNILLGHNEGVRCNSTAASFARYTVASQSWERCQGLACDGDLQVRLEPGQQAVEEGQGVLSRKCGLLTWTLPQRHWPDVVVDDIGVDSAVPR